MPADAAGEDLARTKRVCEGRVSGDVVGHARMVNKSGTKDKGRATCRGVGNCLSLVVTGTAPLVCGNIPVALLKSEGAGSVRILVRLPGAHLCMQVLGN
jgi:hypothetical protein